MKNLKISIENIKIDIDLKPFIDEEVNKELKKFSLKERVINNGSRRSGNTYRAMLEAQFLASEKPDRNIVFLTGSNSYAKDCRNIVMRMAYEVIPDLKIIDYSNKIYYPNGSIIHFDTFNEFFTNQNKFKSLRNIFVVRDNYYK